MEITLNPEQLLRLVIDQADQIREYREDLRITGAHNVELRRIVAQLTPDAQPSLPPADDASLLEAADASVGARGDGPPRIVDEDDGTP